MPTPCWVWNGTRLPSGYGVMSVGIRPHQTIARAHRVSWELHRGPIPTGMCVCHKCDIRACVNPDHLFLGTQYDNILDRAAKGRSSMTNGFHRKPPRGELNRSAKLRESDVRQIRADYANGATTRQLERQYSMTFGGIRNVILRKTWKHVL